MNREKTLALVLLDLCAFACSQDSQESTRNEFEAACRLAEKHSLSEVKIYKAYVSSLEWESNTRRVSIPPLAKLKEQSVVLTSSQQS